MLVRLRLATKASAEVRVEINKLYIILIPSLMINGRTVRQIGTKEAYYILVQLQLKYEIGAARAVTCRYAQNGICIPRVLRVKVE